MKRKMVTMLLCCCIVLGLTGCGGKTENGDAAENPATESSSGIASMFGETAEMTEEAQAVSDAEVVSKSRAFEINGADYVTELCDYSAVPVTITGDYEVTDDMAKEYLERMIETYGPFYVPDTSKTTVTEGDIVNVDYVGKLDGEAFAGGTAENTDIDVYNNSAAADYYSKLYGMSGGYIDGFTDDLKGAKVGDTIDSNVTFPADYGNTDLAGKKVVFTFTVNSIQKEMTIDDVDDTFAKSQFQVDTTEEMYEVIREAIAAQAQSKRSQDISDAVQQYLADNCTVEVPEDYVQARYEDYRTNFINLYCGGDETALADYLNDYYDGTSQEEAEQVWREGIETQVKTELILDAVAKKENIVFDEDGYEEYLDSLLSSGRYEDETSLYMSFGYGDSVWGERFAKMLYVENKALEKINESAVVTEK